MFFSSAKLPTTRPPGPTCEPGRRWLNGPILAPSSTTDDSTIEAQTTQPAPIVLSTICEPAPIVVPCPIDVVPRRITFGSMTTSSASVTVAST